ncbi:MAG: NeuD/PglB/VioB family sugar acetyltransferase [Verrucomicrobiota bacterium]
MITPVIFWGATGQAKVLREFMPAIGYELIAVFDNNREITPPFPDVPLHIGETAFKHWLEEQTRDNVAGLVAIGGARGRDRVQIQHFLVAHRIKPALALHPTAFVAANSHIAPGCQVLAQAAVGAETQMAEACIINTSASVDHECRLGKGVHIGPGAVLAGCVIVGDYSMIGAGAVVLPRVTIGENVAIGAGAVVTRDIPSNKVAYGNPARVMRDNEITA